LDSIPYEDVAACGFNCRARPGYGRGMNMTESIYKIIEIIGTSENSWEEAAKNAVEKAGKSLRDMRVAEVAQLDLKVDNNKVVAYRARVKVSFKYED
jgi:flavin-binding protein dodecin